MTDLHDLLDRASDADAAPTPITDDLARGRLAARRRRRHQGLAGVGAACALGLLAGLAGPPLLDRTDDDAPSVTDTRDSVLFAANQTEGPYTFGKLPVGWEVQGAYPQGVTIAPVGFPNQRPDVFIGKLVISYDQNPLSGEPTDHNGRTFYVRGDAEYGAVAVQTRAGEPEGVVSVQYPAAAGWTVETMIEFLDAVAVGPGAQPGLG